MYQTKNHSKYSLIAHFVFVVKYRHPLLVDLGDYTVLLIKDACKKYNYSLIICETHIDHIHVLLEYNPNDNINIVVKNLKQYTTYYLRKNYDSIISKYIYGSRRFWSKGYFVCSIGRGASYETIKRYIEDQG